MPARERRSGVTIYGAPHARARRDALTKLRDGDPCCLCGQPMFRGHARWLDLDHEPGNSTAYRGLAHRSCNRREGAIRGNRARRLPNLPRRTRVW